VRTLLWRAAATALQRRQRSLSDDASTRRETKDGTDEVDGALEQVQVVPQRRRITDSLRGNVVEYYARGMTSRLVASTLGLGRTTVLNIMKAADVAIWPQGRKY
jgi:hypothetical protein